MVFLRDQGFDVYDYRDPEDGEPFKPDDVDNQDLSLESRRCSARNLAAIADANAVVCVLPSGVSTHFELGFAHALKKPIFLWRRGPLPFEAYYGLMLDFFDLMTYDFSRRDPGEEIEHSSSTLAKAIKGKDLAGSDESRAGS